MKKLLTNHALMILGWFFVLLGLIGVALPLLPTIPFLIVASALFAKSSPRFHQMLLNNKYVGKIISDWEKYGIVNRQIKKRSTIAIIIMFLISIVILHGHTALQIMLVTIAAVLLFFLWRFKENIE